MLTIKHVDTDGTETILECERVEVIQGKGRHNDGIFLDPDRPEGVIGKSGRVGSNPAYLGVSTGEMAGGQMVEPPVCPHTFRHVIHFAEMRSAQDCEPRVYVMNRFGATVATYKL